MNENLYQLSITNPKALGTLYLGAFNGVAIFIVQMAEKIYLFVNHIKPTGIGETAALA